MAYNKVLAAVDESPAGAHALRVGAQIASAAEAALVVLRVVDDPWRFIEPGEVEAKRAMRDGSWATVAAARVGDELRQLMASEGIGSARATPLVRFGLPGVEIARWAELEGADLIVLGRQHVGPLERRPAGRTIDGTVRRARVPCLLVPFGQRTWRRMIVLVDGGAAAADVVQQALQFGEAFGSEILVLEVAPQPAFAAAGATEAIARLPRTGSLDVATREGDPAAELLKAARERQADLLVIGYERGQSAESTSAAARILARAPSAVLTVPV